MDYSSLRVSIRPEVELILCCATTLLERERSERMKVLLQKNLEWQSLLQTAGRNRVLPLLYHHLSTLAPEAVPKFYMDQLRDHVERTLVRSIFLTKELLKILDLLNANGISAIPYKGPVLATCIYGNLALRQFGDLDILIAKRDAKRLKELLLGHGYTLHLSGLTPSQEKALLRSHYTYDFHSADDKVLLEVHWQLAPLRFGLPLDMDRLWERAVPISFQGTTVPTLSPEDLILILCVKGAKNLWWRLRMICDVAEVVRVHKDLRWEETMNYARMLGAERMLSLGLFLADSFLDAMLPEKVLQRVREDTAIEPLAAQIFQRLFRESDGRSMIFEDSQFQPLHLKMRERFRDKVRYCFLLTVTPNIEEWDLIKLPSWLYFIYYLIRPVRLAAKYTVRIFRSVIG